MGPVYFMGGEYGFNEYEEAITEMRKTVEVFAAAEQFSTDDNKGIVYIWGDFGDLEMKTLRAALMKLHPNAQVIFNPENIHPGEQWINLLNPTGVYPDGDFTSRGRGY